MAWWNRILKRRTARAQTDSRREPTPAHAAVQPGVHGANHGGTQGGSQGDQSSNDLTVMTPDGSSPTDTPTHPSPTHSNNPSIPPSLVESGRIIAHDHLLIAFELNWQLVRPGQLRKLQTQALADGYTHQVIAVESDLVGFMAWPSAAREKRPIHAGALLLAETCSLGGDEVFVFSVEGGRYAMVALKNSLPLPGFDLVGSAVTITDAVRNYLSLPHKNEIRRCGDAEILSGAEFFDFAAALQTLDSGHPRVRPIPNVRRYLFIAALVTSALLCVGVAWMGWRYVEAKAEAERLRREGDPNIVYEQSFSNSVASLPPLGNRGLRAMVDTLVRLPLEIQGWRLGQVSCAPSACQATWVRQTGNFADFDAHLPADVRDKPEYGYLTDAKSTQVKTRHPVASTSPKSGQAAGAAPSAFGAPSGPAVSQPPKGFQRESLPLPSQVQAEFVSRLQDYSLIEAKVQVLAPSPFPSGVSDITPIFKPVVSGTWSMELPMWSLPTLGIPDYVQVDALSVELSLRDEAGASHPNYKISGKYYAKGKNY